MKHFLRLWFSFSRKELNGILVLLILILLLVISKFYLSSFFTQKTADFSQFDKEIAAFEAQRIAEQDELNNKESSYATRTVNKGHKELFSFDPNGLSEDN